jgi:hypothetical protein
MNSIDVASLRNFNGAALMPLLAAVRGKSLAGEVRERRAATCHGEAALTLPKITSNPL